MPGPPSRRIPDAVLSAVAAVALVGLSMVRVASTWSVTSETSDEPAHVRSGLEWLGQGTYRFSAVDPPLSRLPVAALPYLAGYRFAPPDVAPPEGLSVDALDSDDLRPLSLARAGVLPLFAMAAAVVWLWARRAGGPLVALLAVFVFALDPAVLAHTGVATTDVELTAVFCGALLAFVAWWESPTAGGALLAGALFGLALASKFVALALPLCALAAGAVLAWVGTRPVVPRRTLALHALGALGVALLVVWASYRFSVGTLDADLDPHTLARLRTGCSSTVCTALSALAGHALPAPAFLHGLWELEWEERVGHPSYLLGAWSQHGFRAYYLVALLVKTPLPELLLGAAGVVLALRAWPRARAAKVLAPVAAAIALVAVASLGRINIGVRHVLPVFALMSVTGGGALAALIRAVPGPAVTRAGARVLAAALAAWLLVESHAPHPGYLSYFNETVGDDGDLVLLDSDLDWGQDLLHLERLLRDRGVRQLSLRYFGPAVLSRHDLPPWVPLDPDRPAVGWVAISAMYRRSPGFAWIGAYKPVARAGRSIDLYLLPPPVAAP